MYQEKLKQVQNELTQTEKIIADFFQNHSLEARSFTSYQLADRLNIGQSTIIRFSKIRIPQFSGIVGRFVYLAD